MNKIIKLKDGFDVEVETSDDYIEEISTNSQIDNSLEQIEEFLTKLISPISNTITKISEDVELESTKVSVGVKIGVEGNFILAKSSANANIQIDMTFKKKDNE